MPSVEVHYPFDERSEARLASLSLPEKLRGVRHRATAQAIFDGWLAAARYTDPPQHWSEG